MAVLFRELCGSPTERYTEDGFEAERRFIVAWEDRDSFAVELLGEAAEHGGTTSTHYPGKETVFAFDVRYEPYDPEDPDQQDLSSLTEGLNSYSNSFALAIVSYKTINENDCPDGPEAPSGTQLSYRLLFSTDDHAIGPGGWSWSDNTTAIPASQNLLKRIPTTEHHVTWKQVVGPPWETIQAMQGKVNQADFLGCSAGTLLFEGVEANKLFRAGIEEGASPFCWEIRYLFREKSIKQGAGTFGWNHAYRENPAGWVEAVNTIGEKLYPLANFDQLFMPATG